MSRIESLNPDNLSQLLGEDGIKNLIPYYQRQYRWKSVGQDAEVVQLWEDLIEYKKSKTTEPYFMGPLLQYRYERNNEETEYTTLAVVDGQQRLVTLSIMLCALRDSFDLLIKEIEKIPTQEEPEETKGLVALCEDRKGRIQTRYLAIKRRNKEGGYWRKLQLSDQGRDEECFRLYRLSTCRGNEPDFNGSAHKTHRINKAYKFFKQRFAEEIKEEDWKEKYETLEKWMEIIERRLLFINIRVADHVDAFTLFETLNTRGKPLTVAELTKNSLYHIGSKLDGRRVKEGSMKKLVDQKWNGNDSVNSHLPRKESRSSFILRYWNSATSPKTTMKKLYKEVYSHLKGMLNSNTSRVEFEDFLDELAINAKGYREIVKPSSNDYKNPQMKNKISTEMKWLNYIGLKQHIPLLLAAKSRNDLDEECFFEILKLIGTIFVVHNIVNQGSPSAMENKLCEWAVHLRDPSNSVEESMTNMFSKAKRFLEYDQEKFYHAFTDINVESGKRCHYILRKIEGHITQTEMDYFKDPQQTQVEHILPKNITGVEKWVEYWDEENHDEYLWKLGNLTLLLDEDNVEASNKWFEEKAEIYEKSKIELTSSKTEKWGCLYDINQDKKTWWDEISIKERQKAMAEIANDIWKID